MKSMLVSLVYMSPNYEDESIVNNMIPITEWDEITYEEYTILLSNLHRIKNPLGRAVLIVKEENINQTLSDVMKQVENELLEEKRIAEQKAAKKAAQRKKLKESAEQEMQYAKEQRAKLYEQLRQEFN